MSTVETLEELRAKHEATARYRVVIDRRGQPDRVVAVGLTLAEARKLEAEEQAKLAAEPGYRSFAMSRPLALIQLQKEVSDETNT